MFGYTTFLSIAAVTKLWLLVSCWALCEEVFLSQTKNVRAKTRPDRMNRS
jgi:hypothetical protein